MLDFVLNMLESFGGFGGVCDGIFFLGFGYRIRLGLGEGGKLLFIEYLFFR